MGYFNLCRYCGYPLDVPAGTDQSGDTLYTCENDCLNDDDMALYQDEFRPPHHFINNRFR
jgi:hypothetical protein